MTKTPPCKTHPDAPHGFDRNASHSSDRYVCECEGWEPDVDVSEKHVDEAVRGVLQNLNAFMHPPVVSSAIRAGRGALGWSQQKLATCAELSLPTVTRLESGLANSNMQTIVQVLNVFTNEGVLIEWGVPGKHYVISVKEKNT